MRPIIGFLLIVAFSILNSCGYTPISTKKDKSFIYLLPFVEGKKVLLVQSYKSLFSHIDDIALDYKVKKGTKICAARSGTVIQIKKDSEKQGLGVKFLSEGNHIIISHEDGSTAWYWHLQKNGVEVAVGQNVEAGEMIGYSGHTGFSAFPHLHFEVQTKNGKQVPTRFYTQKGVEYLKPGRYYKSVRP